MEQQLQETYQRDYFPDPYHEGPGTGLISNFKKRKQKTLTGLWLTNKLWFR